MKTTKTLALLLLAVAASNSAKAQATYVTGCKSYTFSSATAAAGTGTITYQWYRNGAAIAGANSASYTLPANMAYGENVEFKRGVISSNCASEVAFSNAYVISFSGLVVNGLCWAHTNVDSYQTFALIPDMNTKFYQWNRSTAYSATDPLTPAWNATANTSSTWTVNPCPTGWRLPTDVEFNAMFYSWIRYGGGGGIKGAAVDGLFIGPNANTCSLPNNMSNCIFLPVGGVGYYRRNTDGALISTYGNTTPFYWTSTTGEYNSTGTALGKCCGNDAVEGLSGYFDKAYGVRIRCVQ